MTSSVAPCELGVVSAFRPLAARRRSAAAACRCGCRLSLPSASAPGWRRRPRRFPRRAGRARRGGRSRRPRRRLGVAAWRPSCVSVAAAAAATRPAPAAAPGPTTTAPAAAASPPSGRGRSRVRTASTSVEQLVVLAGQLVGRSWLSLSSGTGCRLAEVVADVGAAALDEVAGEPLAALRPTRSTGPRSGLEQPEQMAEGLVLAGVRGRGHRIRCRLVSAASPRD